MRHWIGLAVAAVSTIAVMSFPVMSPAAVAPAALAAPPRPAGQDVEGPDAAVEKVEQNDFDVLVGRIRAARETGAWRGPDWADRAGVGDTLARLVDAAGAAAGREGLKVGPPLADVRPGDLAHGRTKGLLHVAEDIDVAFADRCVLLADNGVRVSHANGCVIIAGGAVHVSHGRGNLIVAGHYLHVGHDGNLPPRDPAAAGDGASVLLAGQVLDVAHARGTVCSSPGQVRISHAHGVTFVNSPDVKTSHRNGCREVPDAPPLAAAPPPRPNPLAGKLDITQMAGGDDPRRAMVVIRRGGVELVTRLGAEVTGPDGKPVDGLAGWRLSFVAGDFALFRRGAETAGFAMPARE